MNVPAEQVKTIEDFEAFIAQPENADRLFEFIDGEIIEVSPGRTYHSGFPHIISFEVRLFCRDHQLPCYIGGTDGTYRIGNNTVAPDFSYKQTPLSRDYPDPVAPLWAVEVISPTDKPGEIAKKRRVYVNAGILLWELYEQSESIHVYAPGKPMSLFGINDVLDGGNVLPGFTLAVKALFDE
jgi:Uma2 family endonuclease